MTDIGTDRPADNRSRLGEIADQIRDGWIRGRGPLTGLAPLVAARAEAEAAGASAAYLEIFDNIIEAAKVLSGKRRSVSFADAPGVLDRNITRLRELDEAV